MAATRASLADQTPAVPGLLVISSPGSGPSSGLGVLANFWAVGPEGFNYDSPIKIIPSGRRPRPETASVIIVLSGRTRQGLPSGDEACPSGWTLVTGGPR